MSYDIDEEFARRTGRTTRIAINLIDAMLKNPGKQFEVIDHTESVQGAQHLYKVVAEMLLVVGIQVTVSQPQNSRKIFIQIDPIRRFMYDPPSESERLRAGLFPYR